MKIAIPTRENRVDDHFGHCAYYSIYNVENKHIISQSTLPSPEGCGCKSNIASVLEEMGVEVMLAGNIGEGAKNVLTAHHIKVIRGCSGNIDDLVNAYMNNQITDSGLGCDHHDCANHQNLTFTYHPKN